mgnify:CR=1 FL=1
MENASTVNTFNPKNVYLVYEDENTYEQYEQRVDTLVQNGTLVSDDDEDMEITSVYTPVVVAKPENAYLIYENGDRQCVADLVQNGTLVSDQSEDLEIVSVEVVSDFI